MGSLKLTRRWRLWYGGSSTIHGPPAPMEPEGVDHHDSLAEATFRSPGGPLELVPLNLKGSNDAEEEYGVLGLAGGGPAACGTSTTTSQTTAASARTTTTPMTTALCGTKTGPPTTSKVMVIWEENHGSASIIGSSSAPYINQLANDCGLATNYTPSTIRHCRTTWPSLRAVNTPRPWTSDCDAGGSCLTSNHNIFDQVGPSGWKSYAESMNGNCQFGSAGPYATKHNPAPYYTDVAAACATNDVPMGTTSSGALHD